MTKPLDHKRAAPGAPSAGNAADLAEAPQAGGEAENAHLSIRIDLGAEARVGPGKVRLLELIDELGSISSAGRAMEMSYRRAWLLVDDLNRCFRRPVVATQMGGAGGGGAVLTPAGREIVACYRAIEAECRDAAGSHLQVLRRLATHTAHDHCRAADRDSEREPCR